VSEEEESDFEETDADDIPALVFDFRMMLFLKGDKKTFN
jgi:hypothetical protein